MIKKKKRRGRAQRSRQAVCTGWAALSHALLGACLRPPSQRYLPSLSGVDPQLYVTITISIIIVLVATGIIFKFW